MTGLNAVRWLRQARKASRELRARGEPFPLADAFFVDRPTRDLLDALIGLGILERQDLANAPGHGPLVSAA
ncbi:MAG TPA: hypothetical protein VEO00_01535 [Actinomycetota bacterium]|nr:hypothetical protein [Actinomycetota bacterium]